MRCRWTERQLSEYLDGTLSPRRERWVAGHLDACGGCRREFEALRDSLRLLETVSPAPPVDDLWASLQASIQAESVRPAARPAGAGRVTAGVPALACRRVEPLLPAYVDAALDERTFSAVGEHLSACAGCRGEEAALSRSLALLDRLPPADPPEDLWERLQARLEATPAAPWARSRWRPGWRFGAAGVGLATAAAVLFFLQAEPDQELNARAPEAMVATRPAAPVPALERPPQPEPPRVTGEPRAQAVGRAGEPQVRSGVKRQGMRRPRRPVERERAPLLANRRPPAAEPAGDPLLAPDGNLGGGLPPVEAEPVVVIVNARSREQLADLARSLAPVGESLEMAPNLPQLLEEGEREPDGDE